LYRWEFSFHFVVPFWQMSGDNLRANAKDAMVISGYVKSKLSLCNILRNPKRFSFMNASTSAMLGMEGCAPVRVTEMAATAAAKAALSRETCPA